MIARRVSPEATWRGRRTERGALWVTATSLVTVRSRGDGALDQLAVALPIIPVAGLVPLVQQGRLSTSTLMLLSVVVGGLVAAGVQGLKLLVRRGRPEDRFEDPASWTAYLDRWAVVREVPLQTLSAASLDRRGKLVRLTLRDARGRRRRVTWSASADTEAEGVVRAVLHPLLGPDAVGAR